MTTLIQHLLYGDVHEMPLSVLGDECPDAAAYNKMDEEQQLRLQIAATIKAWSEGKLHKSGYLWTTGHPVADRVDRPMPNCLLGNLLARIHRDGGHHTAEHGLEKSCSDAQEKVLRWLAADDDANKIRPLICDPEHYLEDR